MKTIIALTFIGILSYTYAQIVPISECKTVTPMKDFNANKFFTGKWFMTHVQAKTSHKVCQAFGASKTPEGKYVTEFQYDELGQENKILCEDDGNEADKKIGFSCKKNGKEAFKTDFVVLDTDYNDYAVFYRCSTLIELGIKADNFGVVRRDVSKEDIPEKAKPITDVLNLLKCTKF